MLRERPYGALYRAALPNYSLFQAVCTDKKDMSLYETEAYGDAVVTVYVHKPQYHIQPMDRWKKAAPLKPHAHNRAICTRSSSGFVLVTACTGE